MFYEGTYRIFPLGDSAVTIDFGNVIDETINKVVLFLFDHLTAQPLPSIIEVVPAYSSLTVYYDRIKLRKHLPDELEVFVWLKEQLQDMLDAVIIPKADHRKLVKIPVCYERDFAPDIEKIMKLKNISAEELIGFHISKEYRVYMLGFLPGFAYLGQVDEHISTPRKPLPAPVVAGSIGIAGNQTGIYPLNSPGGWQIIGRTPVKLFDPDKNEPVLLKAGDNVQFYPITRHEFENY
jgi:inhibitor of KinA